MNNRLMKDAAGWGFILWLIGYALGILLFAFVPTGAIGWIIMRIGTVIAIWVAFYKVKGSTLLYFVEVALAWTAIAMLGDYLFIVRMLKPSDGYYKGDVYLYYWLTFAIPLIAGWRRTMVKATGPS